MFDSIVLIGFFYVSVLLLVGYSLFSFIERIRFDNETGVLTKGERRFLISASALTAICLLLHVFYGVLLFVGGWS